MATQSSFVVVVSNSPIVPSLAVVLVVDLCPIVTVKTPDGISIFLVFDSHPRR